MLWLTERVDLMRVGYKDIDRACGPQLCMAEAEVALPCLQAPRRCPQ